MNDKEIDETLVMPNWMKVVIRWMTSRKRVQRRPSCAKMAFFSLTSLSISSWCFFLDCSSVASQIFCCNFSILDVNFDSLVWSSETEGILDNFEEMLVVMNIVLQMRKLVRTPLNWSHCLKIWRKYTFGSSFQSKNWRNHFLNSEKEFSRVFWRFQRRFFSNFGSDCLLYHNDID